jgi:hypothetical protein
MQISALAISDKSLFFTQELYWDRDGAILEDLDRQMMAAQATLRQFQILQVVWLLITTDPWWTSCQRNLAPLVELTRIYFESGHWQEMGIDVLVRKVSLFFFLENLFDHTSFVPHPRIITASEWYRQLGFLVAHHWYSFLSAASK